MKWAAQLGKQVQQTELACLRPPSQRSKCRYLNVSILTKWAQRMSALMEQRPEKLAEHINWERAEEKFKELDSYHSNVAQWQEMMGVTEQVEHFVRTQGLYAGCAKDLAAQIPAQLGAKAQHVRQELLDHIRTQSKGIGPKERMCASTEVLESAFGKLKNMEQNEGRDGFTSMLLALPALLSITAKDIVGKALETVHTKDITNWVRKNLGHSVSAKRQMAYACAKT